MHHWKRNLLSVWMAQFLCTAGFSFATPFIPFYIKEIGVSSPARVNMWVGFWCCSGSRRHFRRRPHCGRRCRHSSSERQASGRPGGFWC